MNQDSGISHDTCDRLRFSSAQRIFYAPVKSLELDSYVFKPGRAITTQGEDLAPNRYASCAEFFRYSSIS